MAWAKGLETGRGEQTQGLTHTSTHKRGRKVSRGNRCVTGRSVPGRCRARPAARSGPAAEPAARRPPPPMRLLPLLGECPRRCRLGRAGCRVHRAARWHACPARRLGGADTALRRMFVPVAFQPLEFATQGPGAVTFRFLLAESPKSSKS